MMMMETMVKTVVQACHVCMFLFCFPSVKTRTQTRLRLSAIDVKFLSPKWGPVHCCSCYATDLMWK